MIAGVFFDGFSSRDHPATLYLGNDTLTLRVPDANITRSWPADQVRIDAAIPGVRRSVKFPDGSRFESQDDASLSAWERQAGRNRLLGGVRGLESRWTSALAALLVAVAVVGLFVVYGVPALARQAATVTPKNVLATFDQETLNMLEHNEYLGPSKLSAARQQQLQREFRQIVNWAGGAYPYRLLLRDGEPGGADGIGANAFALPNGTIVMTDQLVKLARDDRELMGVLAHESGHVTHRHGLASVYQALGLTLVTTVVTGDLVSASTFAAAVPAALLKGGYSRQAETESDEVSGQFMLQEYGTTQPLQDILARLEDRDSSAESAQPDASQDDQQADSTGHWIDLLSTHPGTPDRIAHLKRMEEQAKGQP